MKTLKQLSDLLESGEITSTELSKLYLDAAQQNNDLGAYITITQDAALEAAEAADKRIQSGSRLGPLDGIPCCVKDNIVTAGIRTTCGSRMLENYTPFYDAFVWKNMKRAGAVLIGKGNMDEFAMGSTTETSYFSPAKNPMNTDCVPGGSSGGVAAAVAGNLAVYGIGSDTGGSIRQPSSFCGLTGLKPTYGTVSRSGLIAYGSSLDQIGPICRFAEDIPLVLDILRGKDPLDMTSKVFPHSEKKPISRMTIGICDALFENCSPAVSNAVMRAAYLIEKMGAKIETISIPLLKYSLPVYYIIACAEAASNLNRYDGVRYGEPSTGYVGFMDMAAKTRNQNFGAEVKRRIMLGNFVLSSGYADAYYKKALRLRNALQKEMNTVYHCVDAIVSPVAPVCAFRFGETMSPVEMYQTDICTVPANLVGLPAMSIPCGFEDGLPIGLQLMGSHFSDDNLIGLAIAFEQETEGSFVKQVEMGVQI